MTKITYAHVYSSRIFLGLGAVTILYALNTSQYFDSIIRFGANANTQMTSAERAVAFTKINPERGHGPHEPPPEDWPRSGEVEFQNTSLRYYKGGPEVIKNISFKVNSKEKIGIVGRTGAGKSSLVAALMRLALTEGHIFVDGLDIRQIDVVSSRRAISVISQAPNLMNGTVKTNLDPYNEFSDTEIWSALKQTKMSSIISSLPQKLENEISSGGSSFSLGERQLMHLTRVLLKKSKIIIFDEATGKVDKKTDDDIQSIVRDVCEECTVITIAHRLSTVLDCNRILILDQGKIVDYGAPQLLLSKENSLLKQLVDISSEK